MNKEIHGIYKHQACVYLGLPTTTPINIAPWYVGEIITECMANGVLFANPKELAAEYGVTELNILLDLTHNDTYHQFNALTFLTAIFREVFIMDYPEISQQPAITNRDDIIRRINSGDCGTYSLCLYNFLTAMEYVGNLSFSNIDDEKSGHALLQYGTMFYDSRTSCGYGLISDCKHYTKDAKVGIVTDYEQQREQWVHHTDDIGHATIAHFDTHPILTKVITDFCNVREERITYATSSAVKRTYVGRKDADDE